ncbi:MAG: hypothetical protein AAGC55_01510 [Myxococcota bacterium]
MKHLINPSLTITLALASLGVLGCDSQVDPTFPGDSLATLQGNITSELTEAPGEAEAVLVWFADTGEGDFIIAERVVVGSDFPSSFEMDVFTPPPADAIFPISAELNGGQESGIAFAMMIAVESGTDITDESQLEAGLLGLAEHHMLLYVKDNAVGDATLIEEDGEPSSIKVGESLAPGFHIMDLVPKDDSSCGHSTFDCLIVAPQDLDTDIPVRLSLDPFFYNWT